MLLLPLTPPFIYLKMKKIKGPKMDSLFHFSLSLAIKGPKMDSLFTFTFTFTSTGVEVDSGDGSALYE